jgi:(2Fe-2S) ferredoxin
MPHRDRYLWVCLNARAPGNPKGCCHSKQAQAVHDALKMGIVQRGLRRQVRVMTSSCLDFCGAGPAIALQPDNLFYGSVGLDDVADILDSLEAGTVVERLRVPSVSAADPGARAARDGGG